MKHLKDKRGRHCALWSGAVARKGLLAHGCPQVKQCACPLQADAALRSESAGVKSIMPYEGGNDVAHAI